VKFESRIHTVFQNHKMKAKKVVQDMESGAMYLKLRNRADAGIGCDGCY
jgi:hypothetical protein